MVLCIEPEKIYSPGGCHEIAFPSTFSHDGPPPNRENAVRKLKIAFFKPMEILFNK